MKQMESYIAIAEAYNQNTPRKQKLLVEKVQQL